MTGARRGRSLFWTIAGLFLLTLALGTLLQVLVADEVLRPLEGRDARARADLVVAVLAVDLAAAPPDATPAMLDSLLARRRDELGPHPEMILYRGADSTLLAAMPPRVRLFEQARALEPPAQREADRARVEILAQRAVWRGTRQIGTVLVQRPTRPRGEPGSRAVPTAWLFLPIAALGSMVAGLVVVRLLVRRLRALEVLAARVAEGDLTVRIADPRGDEIGRLAERLDRMTDRLAGARDQLEATERQRRQLFADITHELATPLTSIRGYAETLLDPHVPLSEDERKRYKRGMLEESRRLDRMIKDLFELARLEAGATPIERERLDWAALCRNTVERFEPRFAGAGLRLAWKSGVHEAWIEADGHRLEEVLENLLANALRYVPSGGTVELTLDRPLVIPARYRLSVVDNGPGVAAEELPRVFERFYRASEVRGENGSRDDGGSGLGLAIVREIIERHGGTVSAATHEPHGLAIHVELMAA